MIQVPEGRPSSHSHSSACGTKSSRHPAPQGRPSLAQRFSAGKSGTHDSSPGGTTEFSLTLFSAAVTLLLLTAASAEKLDLVLAFGWRSGSPLRLLRCFHRRLQPLR